MSAVVAELDDSQALVEALIENIHREDLNPVDRGEALRRLRVSIAASSWEEVGRAIGLTRRHVYHLLNATDLPDPIREDVRVGIVSEKHGRALMRLRNHPELQLQLWDRIINDKLTGDQALRAEREMLPGSDGISLNAEPKLAALRSAVLEILRLLPNATVREIRELRRPMEALSTKLSEILTDAFYSQEEQQLTSIPLHDRNRRELSTAASHR
jgi:ParB family chromosome partitioning protein